VSRALIFSSELQNGHCGLMCFEYIVFESRSYMFKKNHTKKTDMVTGLY